MVTKYTNDKTDSEVYQKMNDIYSKIEPSASMKKTHCQYLAKSGNRYCLATSLKNCQKCKHFTPTTQSKMRILVEYVLTLESENKTLGHELKRCQGTIQEQEITIKAMENSIKYLESAVKTYTLEHKYDKGRVRQNNNGDKKLLPEGN